MPDAWPAVRAYLACRTQWAYAPSGLPTGLRYADCTALLRARWDELGIARAGWPALLADLQVIERAIVDAVAERHEQERVSHGRA